MPLIVLRDDESYSKWLYGSARSALKSALDKVWEVILNSCFPPGSSTVCLLYGFPADHSKMTETLRRIQSSETNLYTLLLIPVCECHMKKISLEFNVETINFCPDFQTTEEDEVPGGWAETGITSYERVSEEEFVRRIAEKIQMGMRKADSRIAAR